MAGRVARPQNLAKIPALAVALALPPGFVQHQGMRTLPPLLLVLCLLQALLGCRDAPAYIDPSRFDQAAKTTGGPRPRLFARNLATREKLPEALVADALQMGWICLDLPKKPRPRLLPMRGDGKLRVIERDDHAAWQVLAVDLATRTATVETALPDWHAEPVSNGWVVTSASAPTLTDDDARALAIDVSATGEPTTLGGLWWLQPAPVDLAPTATHVESFVTDAASLTAWYIDAPGDGTPTLWQVGLAEAPTPLLLGEAEHLWGVVNDGKLLVVRGAGENGSETQLFEPESRRRWRVGPDAVVVVVAANRIFLQDVEQQLWTIGEWPIEEVPLPGARPGDRLLTGGGEAAVVRRFPGPVEQLAWIEATTLQSVGSLGPARWVAATPMGGGVVAALVGHDTNGSGLFDPASDVADVCIVARALRPLVVPERNMPAGANLEGLPGATLHVVRAWPDAQSAPTDEQVLLATLQLPTAASLTSLAELDLDCGVGREQARYVQAIAMDSRQWRDLCGDNRSPRWLPDAWMHPGWSVGRNLARRDENDDGERIASRSGENSRTNRQPRAARQTRPPAHRQKAEPLSKDGDRADKRPTSTNQAH